MVWNTKFGVFRGVEGICSETWKENSDIYLITIPSGTGLEEGKNLIDYRRKHTQQNLYSGNRTLKISGLYGRIIFLQDKESYNKFVLIESCCFKKHKDKDYGMYIICNWL